MKHVKQPKAEAPAETPAERDWRETLFLPKTDFPMKAGLPKREPELLERWEKLGLYKRLRKDAKGRPPFTLHDGPPYANGNIHIGTGMNKILKDAVVRSQQMMGRDANYVPGWDCHGLPIEWKIEEQYRAKGKNKDDVPIIDFRRECREFADHWIEVQREEFKRLGVEGDWSKPYLTMSYDAEAAIADEVMKFAMAGALYQGLRAGHVVGRGAHRAGRGGGRVLRARKPDGVREVSAAGVPGKRGKAAQALADAKVVIWTTTPWTIPGNRAIAYSQHLLRACMRSPMRPRQLVRKGRKADRRRQPRGKPEERRADRSVGALATWIPPGFVCRHPLPRQRL